MDRKDVGSWLDGPGAGTQTQDFPGQRLGRPASGPGSIARFGRRLLAALIDWGMCLLIAWGLFDVPLAGAGARGFLPNVIFLVENLVLVSTLGSTFGHRLLGLRVTRLDGAPALPGAVAIRSVLVSLGLPALFWDADQRGLHDQLARTVIVRA